VTRKKKKDSAKTGGKGLGLKMKKRSKDVAWICCGREGREKKGWGTSSYRGIGCSSRLDSFERRRVSRRKKKTKRIRPKKGAYARTRGEEGG